VKNEQTLKSCFRDNYKSEVMKFTLTLRSLWPYEEIRIADGRIAEGITIKQEFLLRKVIIGNAPSYFLVTAAKNYALPVVATLTADYIIRYLKGLKNKEIKINDQTVNINQAEIKQVIIDFNQSEDYAT
jgi:hypothetical protein